ncbi:PadR family transcriptional regulator [Clostridium weizhouense]|uniref:PadR family transcriptional regulator n=1 Tax=Clostridium weizhouense TaxID=2859781 RepID=A0ABS7AR36_9CLOT|nr:PadR family transcriptional regulator [Clostridium weizhouense]MBW6411119.1 PadR family transcriptional regulator [Clostridium weizhouense]
MSNFDFYNIKDIRAEEKRLYEEYKNKVSELKKVKKEKDAVGQVFTKGLLPIYVLYILSLKPTNGNEISTQIGIRTNGKWIPSTGGIYPLLKKLEKEQLILGAWDDPNKKFQKIYHLTPKGKVEYENKKKLLKPKIEESLEVFKIIYNDIY